MAQPHRIRAVTFDADGTLWDFMRVMRHSLSRTLEELERLEPASAALLSIDGMIETRNRVAGELKGKATNLEEIRLQAFRASLTEIGRPNDALARRLNDVYLTHRFEDIKLYADVLPTLQALRGTYALGLLSNGNSYPERCGLDGVFQSVVFSQEHGVEKPDRAIFEIALKQIGCRPEELLHVGDSLENDVRGAQACGIRTAWLNRDGAPNGTVIRPDHEIRSLAELPGVLCAGAGGTYADPPA
jgi:putative hydrolase of the HAD superfamily